MVFADLRENREACSDIGAIHAARSHIYGEREFEYKTRYKDKVGVALRFKAQAHRLQFRMDLKADMEFFNQLHIGDLQTALTEGDLQIFHDIPARSKGSVNSENTSISRPPWIFSNYLYSTMRRTSCA